MTSTPTNPGKVPAVLRDRRVQVGAAVVASLLLGGGLALYDGNPSPPPSATEQPDQRPVRTFATTVGLFPLSDVARVENVMPDGLAGSTWGRVPVGAVRTIATLLHGSDRLLTSVANYPAPDSLGLRPGLPFFGDNDSLTLRLAQPDGYWVIDGTFPQFAAPADDTTMFDPAPLADLLSRLAVPQRAWAYTASATAEGWLVTLLPVVTLDGDLVAVAQSAADPGEVLISDTGEVVRIVLPAYRLDPAEQVTPPPSLDELAQAVATLRAQDPFATSATWEPFSTNVDDPSSPLHGMVVEPFTFGGNSAVTDVPVFGPVGLPTSLPVTACEGGTLAGLGTMMPGLSLSFADVALLAEGDAYDDCRWLSSDPNVNRTVTVQMLPAAITLDRPESSYEQRVDVAGGVGYLLGTSTSVDGSVTQTQFEVRSFTHTMIVQVISPVGEPVSNEVIVDRMQRMLLLYPMSNQTLDLGLTVRNRAATTDPATTDIPSEDTETG